MVRHEKAEPKLLTETELELMTILWELQEGSVHDVIEQLPSGRALAYTSVSTILRILEQKKFLGARKVGRGHVYFPLLAKADYESVSLHHLLDKVFDGEPLALVSRLIETKGLTQQDLQEVRALLREQES